MRKILLAVIVSILATFTAADSASALGATLVFKSGLRIYVSNGYEKIVDALSKIDPEARHKIVSLDVEGGIFLLDVAEVTVVCKEKCTSIEIVDTRATAK